MIVLADGGWGRNLCKRQENADLPFCFKKGGLFWIFKVLYSILLHQQPLRFF